ncbi:MAG: CRISPR-associated endonuclease Cas2 [Chloroherpetonaceae bacterium]|nr:CRISPR-associated endonuclease Cas2 [Chloroherpetonaceae bacterium]
MNFYVISYDIESNPIRNRIFKTLKDFGTPVQKSVFECFIPYLAFQQLRSKLTKLLSRGGKNDSIRYYSFCEKCVASVIIDTPEGANHTFKPDSPFFIS